MNSTCIFDLTYRNQHMNEKTAVEVSDLRKTYKGGNVCALNGISFSVEAGEIFGLIGPNGAGKTTLIGCLLGLLKPDSGTISIFGKPVDVLSVRRITGYVPERADFEYWMTGRQFLHYHHGLAGLPARSVHQEVEEALQTVELSRTAWDRRLKTYSRGMLQRLNLAQFLIGRPKLVLMDEPTLGLDPTGVTVVRNIVSKMRAEGVTAIINSHQLDEVERLCDRVAFIRQGTIAYMERIKGGTISDYGVFIRWSDNSLNGSTTSVVAQVALNCGARVSECREQWGRFVVSDNRAAARLVRELVEQGLPVDEVVPERMRLEQLFAQTNGGGFGE